MNKDGSKKTEQSVTVLRGFLHSGEAAQLLRPEVYEALCALLDTADLLGTATKAGAVPSGVGFSNTEAGLEPSPTPEEWRRLKEDAPLLGKLAAWVSQDPGNTAHLPRSEIAEVKITFAHTSVTVNGQPVNKDAAWLLAEYLILREARVYWPWACVILPTFDVEDPDRAFRNYLSKRRYVFGHYGIRIATYKKKGEDGAHVFEGMDDNIVSNIKDVKTRHARALKEYEAGDRARAVSTLSRIAEDDQNDWYMFTATYMALSRWICELRFEHVAEHLIGKCVSFLTWYCKKLQLGIPKAARYVQLKAPGQESLQALEDMRTELRRAEVLRRALVEQRPLTEDDKDYEDTAALMLNHREKYVSIRGEVERELDRDTVVEVVQSYCERNRVLAAIIADGRDELDKVAEAKHQRHKWNTRHIEDLHKELYWFLHEAIVEMENFDAFDRGEGNKLTRLMNYLRSCLFKELKKCI